MALAGMLKMKFFLQILVPELAWDVFRILKRASSQRRNRFILNRNTALKTIFQNHSSAVFLGNGPSLSLSSIKSRSDIDIFVCNDFFLVPGSADVDITFYMNFDVSEKWLLCIDNFISINRPKYFVFSLNSRPILEQYNFFQKFPEADTFFVNGMFETNFDHLYMDVDRTTFNIKNVILGYMLLARYIGYDTAYMLGVDFSFLTSKTKAEIPHAYNMIDSCANVTDISSYGQLCRSAAIILEYIERIDKYSNVRYVNCTENSYIDVLQFGRLEP